VNVIRALAAEERGLATVEFALVFPFVIFMLFGVMDFGRALTAYDTVSSAARLGSRYAMVRGNACPTAPACTVSSTQIQTYVRSAVGGGVAASSLTVTTTWPTASGCAGGTPASGCPVNVAVTYPFSFLGLFQLTLTLSAASQMVISQ
jgi:Flp pilus assembly protein TadG